MYMRTHVHREKTGYINTKTLMVAISMGVLMPNFYPSRIFFCCCFSIFQHTFVMLERKKSIFKVVCVYNIDTKIKTMWYGDSFPN